jgi:hypothetical protein
MRHAQQTACLLTALLGAASLAVGQTPLQKQVGTMGKGVKAKENFGGFAGSTYEGTVIAKDDTTLTLLYRREGTTHDEELVFHAVDVLRKGRMHKSARGYTAYRWEDVKEGDAVQLWAIFDTEDKVEYCTELCVRRRPGGKLPESQDPKEDCRFRQDTLMNDIDNGEDVSDAAVKRAFPLRPNGFGGYINPGHLSPEYCVKLDAIRAKKEKDPKATLPEKK